MTGVFLGDKWFINLLRLYPYMLVDSGGYAYVLPVQ